MKYPFVIALLASFILFSCGKDSPNEIETFTANDLNLSVNQISDIGNTIYPSVLVSTSVLATESGNTHNLFDFTYTSPEKDSKVTFTLNENTLADETTSINYSSGLGLPASIIPDINWNYDQLKKLKQPGTVNFSLNVAIDDELVTTERIPVNYRSINECVYGFVDNEGNYINTSFLFAAYVNEDHPLIDEVLREALDHGIVNSFSGYQKGPEVVRDEVFALWYMLQKKGVKYSSITANSNVNQRVISQYVRLFEEVWNNDQANCVDGTVFLASILKKIGIDPILVLVPGHMYLAYYAGPNNTALSLLETTSIGNIDLSKVYVANNVIQGYEHLGSYTTPDDLRLLQNGVIDFEGFLELASNRSFNEATNIQISSFNEAIPIFNSQSDPRYAFLSVKELRSAINPISNKRNANN